MAFFLLLSFWHSLKGNRLFIPLFICRCIFLHKKNHTPVVLPAAGGCCTFPAHFSTRRGSLRLLEPEEDDGEEEVVVYEEEEKEEEGASKVIMGLRWEVWRLQMRKSSLWLPSDQSSSSGQQDGRSTGVQDTRLGSAPVWSESSVWWVWSSLLFCFVF